MENTAGITFCFRIKVLASVNQYRVKARHCQLLPKNISMKKRYFDDPISRLKSWENEMIEQFGWYIHFVLEDDSCPNSINYHTHGLQERFNHPDLQICFPISEELAHAILNTIVEQIQTGKLFQTAVKYDHIIGGGFKLEFIDAIESKREVLRIAFPNKEGGYEGEVYRCQFDL